jgi:hypothetical protein
MKLMRIKHTKDIFPITIVIGLQFTNVTNYEVLPIKTASVF